jgi:hypothetical protein
MALVYESSANLPVGSRTLNVNSVTYVVEGDFAPVYGTRELRRNDVNGDQSDLQIRTEAGTLTVTLQQANTSMTRPLLGQIANINSANWVVVSVTPHEPQGEYGTFEISLRTPAAVAN